MRENAAMNKTHIRRLRAVVNITALLILPSSIPLGEQSGGTADASPRLFFTDLESGPNTGGQDNLGSFITIYRETSTSSRPPAMIRIRAASRNPGEPSPKRKTPFCPETSPT